MYTCEKLSYKWQWISALFITFRYFSPISPSLFCPLSVQWGVRRQTWLLNVIFLLYFLVIWHRKNDTCFTNSCNSIWQFIFVFERIKVPPEFLVCHICCRVPRMLRSINTTYFPWFTYFNVLLHSQWDTSGFIFPVFLHLRIRF